MGGIKYENIFIPTFKKFQCDLVLRVICGINPTCPMSV
jgi:hypothetical protein